MMTLPVKKLIGVIAIFLSTIFICLLLGILPRDKMEYGFIHGTYWILSVLFFMTVATHVRWFKTFFVSRHHLLLALLSSFFFTLVLKTSEPMGYKVLSDETNLVSVSKSMYINATVFNITMGKWMYHSFIPTNLEIPLRPFLYPYLVHFFHAFLGYSASHAFLLNLVLAFLSLFFLFTVVSKHLNPVWAFCAQLALCAQPIFSICARSAGFDLLAVVLFFWLMFLWWDFLKIPSREALLNFFLTALLLSQTRYEYPILYPVLALVTFLSGRVKAEWLTGKEGFVYALSPLFLLPRLWQAILMKGKYENAPGDSVVSLENVKPHTLQLLNGLVDFSLTLPFATLFNLFALFLGALLILAFVRKKISLSDKIPPTFSVGVILCVVLLNLVYLAHHGGNFAHPAQSRFFLLFTVCVTLLPFFYQAYLKTLSLPFMFSLSLISFLIYHPIASDERFVFKLLIIRKDRLVKEFLEQRGDHNVMVIADRPGQYVAEDYGAVDFNWFKLRGNILRNEYKMKYYREILAIEEVSMEGDQEKVEGFMEIPTDMIKVPIWERAITDNRIIRISKVDFVQ